MVGCAIAGCLIAISPRIIFIVLWVIGWFQGSSLSTLPMIIGLFFLPITTIFVAYTMKGGGVWNANNIILLVFAIILDVSVVYSGKRGNNNEDS